MNCRPVVIAHSYRGTTPRRSDDAGVPRTEGQPHTGPWPDGALQGKARRPCQLASRLAPGKQPRYPECTGTGRLSSKHTAGFDAAHA